MQKLKWFVAGIIAAAAYKTTVDRLDLTDPKREQTPFK